jgi:hypothetical protein
MMVAVEFRLREERRAAERHLSRSRGTHYRWRSGGVGQCERCRDGVVQMLWTGTRAEPQHDSFGRPMKARTIFNSGRLCTAHAFLKEVQR